MQLIGALGALCLVEYSTEKSSSCILQKQADKNDRHYYFQAVFAYLYLSKTTNQKVEIDYGLNSS
ncbi:MAG: hypothetical protein IPM47_11580 [Sphingobacteriales bacterium]|nr:MAG: hypothetical protein IPM47_11580 [Sphingobacteriales bacterium]